MSVDLNQRNYWDGLAAIDPDSAVIDPNDQRGCKNAYLAALRDHAISQSLERCRVSAGTLLDVGCGTGSAVYPLLAAGHSVVGVDISSGLLRHARRRCGEHRCLFVITNGRQLPFISNSFDAVVIYVVLSYVVDEAAALTLLSEIRDVLKPGSPLVMIEQARRKRRISEEGRKVQRTFSEWEQLLLSAGFKLGSSTILRHGRFPTTPFVRMGLVPQLFWPMLRKVEAGVAARTGVFGWDYAEIRFEAFA